MRAYQETFGVIDWNCENDVESSLEVGRSMRQGHSAIASMPRGDGSTDVMLPEQTLKIQKVRDRCALQNKALSNWWKVAVQRNVQQRMVRCR